MIAVTSHAWTSDPDGAAAGYAAGIAEFGEFHRAQPGFRGRLLLRSSTDDTHFTHIRFFDSLDDYHSMIHRSGYAEHIEALTQFLRAHEGAPGKDFVEVVVAQWPDPDEGP